LLGTILLILIAGVVFLSTKAFGIERAAGTSFFVVGILAVFLRIMGLINNFVLGVAVIFSAIGIYLLVKESAQYEQ